MMGSIGYKSDQIKNKNKVQGNMRGSYTHASTRATPVHRDRGAAAASSGRPKRGFRAFFSCVKTHDT